MKDLVFIINGKEYMLFDYTMVNKKSSMEFVKQINEVNGIIQQIRVIKNLIESNYVRIKVLIPSNKALEFACKK